MADLVVSTLDAGCRAPLLIVAEDAHWFDETTSEICIRLADAARRRGWLVCVTRRPDTDGGFQPRDPEDPTVAHVVDGRRGAGVGRGGNGNRTPSVRTSATVSWPAPAATHSSSKSCFASSGPPTSRRCPTHSTQWRCARSTPCGRPLVVCCAWPPFSGVRSTVHSSTRLLMAESVEVGCGPARGSASPTRPGGRWRADSLPPRPAPGGSLREPPVSSAPRFAPDGGRHHRARRRQAPTESPRSCPCISWPHRIGNEHGGTHFWQPRVAQDGARTWRGGDPPRTCGHCVAATGRFGARRRSQRCSSTSDSCASSSVSMKRPMTHTDKPRVS